MAAGNLFKHRVDKPDVLIESPLKKYTLSGVIPDELEQLNLIQFRQAISDMNRIVYEFRDDEGKPPAAPY
ncbi:hypothetical protein [Hydromonas duriensis]|uniref:Uncharacterized protein n=1 Tax=Hydromonas duriensis TaxID=1527608 RepID=A0A4R6Y578_9BURK|nr:hypothetical protein [Hydromonas duriensis]TDR30253.1 hypothetical protein DFR44_12429 [Hydromonas duriensis]